MIFEADFEKESARAFCSWLIDNGYVFEIQFVSDAYFRIQYQSGKK